MHWYEAVTWPPGCMPTVLQLYKNMRFFLGLPCVVAAAIFGLRTTVAKPLMSPYDPKALLKGNPNRRILFQSYFRKLRILQPQDFFYSADLSALWRRHLIWARNDGQKLIDIVTSRFASTNILLSLLFAAEVGTYFSPSDIVTGVRNALAQGTHSGNRLEFAAGIMLIVSIIVTGAAILANYTALGVFRTVGYENAAVVMRSDVGLYAATLPSRLTVLSILFFFTWLLMFWWVNINGVAAPCILTVLTVGFVMHIFSTFSICGRIIMASSAMGDIPILPQKEEGTLTPQELTRVLLAEVEMAQQLNMEVREQYRLNRSTDSGPDVSYEESLRRRYPGVELAGRHANGRK